MLEVKILFDLNLHILGLATTRTVVLLRIRVARVEALLHVVVHGAVVHRTHVVHAHIVGTAHHSAVVRTIPCVVLKALRQAKNARTHDHRGQADQDVDRLGRRTTAQEGHNKILAQETHGTPVQTADSLKDQREFQKVEAHLLYLGF